MDNLAHYMQAVGPMVDMTANMILGEESVEKLGGLEGVRKRVRAFLEEDEGYGADKGFTLTWISIVACGKKPQSSVTSSSSSA